MTAVHVAAFFPNHCADRSHSHTCLSICHHLGDEALSVELHVPSSEPPARRPYLRDALEALGPLARVALRIDRRGKLRAALQRRAFRRALRRADAAYLWAATPEWIFEDVRNAGVPLFLERINTHRATARPILDEAYRRVGERSGHGITDAAMLEESRKLAMATFVFAPSPLVRQSLLDAGVPAGKVLSSSYGWSPERLRSSETRPAPRGRPPRPAPRGRPFRALFLGSVSVRKGAHLLLEAWAQARIHGTLELVGELLPEIRRVSARHLGRREVVATGYQADVAEAYGRADVLVFPTLEEGSPLVVYEAMASGLPILTTPMGAGEVVRDEVEGVVLDPYDTSRWVRELQRLAADTALRTRLGAAARARAQEYTWARVAERRRGLVLAALARARGVEGPRSGKDGRVTAAARRSR